MTTLILNLLVGFAAASAIVGSRYEAEMSVEKAKKYGRGYWAWRGVMAFTALGLWVWLAVDTGRWQFAAIVAAGFLINVGAASARKATR